MSTHICTTAKGSHVEIQSILVLSTGHVTKETGELIDSDNAGLFTPHFRNEYGWIWYVPPDDENTVDTFPAEFIPIFKLARALDCWWIRFDCDSSRIEELPFYEW